MSKELVNPVKFVDKTIEEIKDKDLVTVQVNSSYSFIGKTEEEVIEIIKTNPESFYHIPDNMLTHTICIAGIEAGVHFRLMCNMCKKTIWYNDIIMRYINKSPDIIDALVQYGEIFSYPVYETMIKQNGCNIRYIPRGYTDLALMMLAIETTPKALKYISKKHQTYHMCELAVEKDITTLAYVYNSLFYEKLYKKYTDKINELCKDNHKINNLEYFYEANGFDKNSDICVKPIYAKPGNNNVHWDTFLNMIRNNYIHCFYANDSKSLEPLEVDPRYYTYYDSNKLHAICVADLSFDISRLEKRDTDDNVLGYFLLSNRGIVAEKYFDFCLKPEFVNKQLLKHCLPNIARYAYGLGIRELYSWTRNSRVAASLEKMGFDFIDSDGDDNMLYCLKLDTYLKLK